MSFYFDAFESRTPPEPIPFSARRELLFQYLATITVCLGFWYVSWRWIVSLNKEALWFAVPLVMAETGAYIGLVLFTINLWRTTDMPLKAPPATLNECVEEQFEPDRPLIVDIFFATYNEDPELVRLGIQDAKRVHYPHPIDLRIHVLDDGRRRDMRKIAEQEGVGYLTRSSNVGFKAGNLRNAIELTSGDFIVICDADTRMFPTMLERTLGYFRDPRMAWVQTPQWFYDLPEGEALPDLLRRWAGRSGAAIGRAAERIAGPIRIGFDPFTNDPQMFYDVLLRRRNWANGAFCCGAGSIHRREAVMEAALRAYGRTVDDATSRTLRGWARSSRERDISPDLENAVRLEAMLSEEFTPYKFHVSEDIYTSIILHSDRERGWRSWMHPYVESKMLSPQDLLSWTIQRFKYAGGTLDIAIHDNALFRRGGLTWAQRAMYGMTFWSYLGGIWNFVFLMAPVIYLFSGIAPIEAFTPEFYAHFIPFTVMFELAMMVGMWGIPGYASKASYIAFFPVNIRALWTVLRGRKISFPVTPKMRTGGRRLRVVWPQLTLMILTIAGLAFGWWAAQANIGHYTRAGLLSNTFWSLNNIIALSGIVAAACWQPIEES